MAGTLVNFFLSPLEAKHDCPRPRPGGGIFERDLVFERVRANTPELFDHMQVFRRSHEVTLRVKIRGVDDQRLSLPMAPRIAVPLANRRWKVRPAVKWNDTGLVDHLHFHDHIFRSLKDLVVTVGT